jgi:hypothetical protein
MRGQQSRPRRQPSKEGVIGKRLVHPRPSRPDDTDLVRHQSRPLRLRKLHHLLSILITHT